MRIVKYTEDDSERLAAALAKVDAEYPLEFEAALLRVEQFLRHYFLSYPDCSLYLLLDDCGDVVATLGSEQIRIRLAGKSYLAAVLSNTYSMKAGAISFLLLEWMKSAEIGLMLPGNDQLRTKVADQKRWKSIGGLNAYYLNWGYPAQQDDALWKRLGKPAARRLMRVDPGAFRRKATKRLGRPLEVVEEAKFDEEMAACGGPFGFRVDPGVDYLNWRFSTALDYVRYRLFRIVSGSSTRGFVVLAEWPNRLLVSHCDGFDPEELALGVVLAVAELNIGAQRYRQTILWSSHLKMREVFHEFGFRSKRTEERFFLARLGQLAVEIPPSGDWLVNMDLGDAGIVAGMVYVS